MSLRIITGVIDVVGPTRRSQARTARDFVAEAGDRADAVHAAMMGHGDGARSNHFDGKGPDEIQEMRQRMDAHVRQAIADPRQSTAVPRQCCVTYNGSTLLEAFDDEDIRDMFVCARKRGHVWSGPAPEGFSEFMRQHDMERS